MGGRKKIVVIDDEEDFCFFVKKNLENTGEFIVFTANDGEGGLALAKLEKPDLILLDIMMPNQAGPDVADILRNSDKTKDIPVVFLTAIVTKAEIGVETMREIGGHNYIAKPIEIADLVDSIKKALNKPVVK